MNKEIILNGKIYVLKENQKPIDDEYSRAFNKGYQRGLLKLTKENQIKSELIKNIKEELTKNSNEAEKEYYNYYFDEKLKEFSKDTSKENK